MYTPEETFIKTLNILLENKLNVHTERHVLQALKEYSKSMKPEVREVVRWQPKEVIRYRYIGIKPLGVDVDGYESDMVIIDKKVIIDLIIEYTGEDYESVFSKKRKGGEVYARYLIVWFLRMHTHINQNGIAKIIKRHHSTIIHAFESMRDMLTTDNDVKRDVLNIEQLLNPPPALLPDEDPEYEFSSNT